LSDQVRLLTAEDAEAWFALRREMLVDTPHSYLASPEDDSFTTVEVVRERLSNAPESVVFGAFVEGGLVGAVGLFREERVKTRHRAWIWGVYLAPTARGRGLATGMMEAAVAHGRALEGVDQLCLTLSARAPEARRLYERVGFTRWGVEPRALQLDGRLLDEVHMVLLLDGPQAGQNAAGQDPAG